MIVFKTGFKKKKVKIAFILMLFLGWLIWESRSPDLTLKFSRTIPSHLEPSRLDAHVSSVSRWPQWFFNLEKVTFVNKVQSDQISKGDVVRLFIQPKRSLSRSFELVADVLDYVPSKKLELRVREDTSGRLTRLFEFIDWSIEFKPSSDGTLIFVEERAKTKHWKSRLFGRLSERILMNQVFYPDVLKLSELRQPFGVDEGPKVGGGEFGTATH